MRVHTPTFLLLVLFLLLPPLVYKMWVISNTFGAAPFILAVRSDALVPNMVSIPWEVSVNMQFHTNRAVSTYCPAPTPAPTPSPTASPTTQPTVKPTGKCNPRTTNSSQMDNLRHSCQKAVVHCSLPVVSLVVQLGPHSSPLPHPRRNQLPSPL